MKKFQYIISLAFMFLLAISLPACNETDDFSLSCGEALTIVEGSSDVIEVRGAIDFSIKTDNNNVACEKNGSTITVTGVKVGQTRLTVSNNEGQQLSCVITVDRSELQKNFVNDRTPRIENWMHQVIRTETTAGLQVTRENNLDADGYVSEGTTSFGFCFVETGDFCRLSAKGDFASRGVYQDGKIAICSDGKTEYYLCEKVDVQKVYDGHVWIVVTCKELPEIRIVTEVF